jgi:isoleucyl-tRNA synthetase
LTDGLGAEHRARVENWNKLLPLRDEVLKSLETARQEKVIGAPLEASVRLFADDSWYPLLETYARELPGLFIVSEVLLCRQTESGVRATIERAPGTKCERCWKYTEDVGSDAEIPTACAACAAVVRETLE